MSETLNTGIRNNIAEIKCSINKMRNVFDRIITGWKKQRNKLVIYNTEQWKVIKVNKRKKKELYKMRICLWNSVTPSNIIICIIEVPEKEEKEKRRQKMY